MLVGEKWLAARGEAGAGHGHGRAAGRVSVAEGAQPSGEDPDVAEDHRPLKDFRHDAGISMTECSVRRDAHQARIVGVPSAQFVTGETGVERVGPGDLGGHGSAGVDVSAGLQAEQPDPIAGGRDQSDTAEAGSYGDGTVGVRTRRATPRSGPTRLPCAERPLDGDIGSATNRPSGPSATGLADPSEPGYRAVQKRVCDSSRR